MYNSASSSTHAGTYDQHLHLAKYWCCLQSPFHQPCTWISTWTSALVYWDCMGIFNTAGIASVPMWDSNPLLGQVLWLLTLRSMVSLYCSHSCPYHLLSICCPFLSFIGHTQVWGDSVRNTWIGTSERTDRSRWCRRASKWHRTVFKCSNCVALCYKVSNRNLLLMDSCYNWLHKRH